MTGVASVLKCCTKTKDNTMFACRPYTIHKTVITYILTLKKIIKLSELERTNIVEISDDKGNPYALSCKA